MNFLKKQAHVNCFKGFLSKLLLFIRHKGTFWLMKIFSIKVIMFFNFFFKRLGIIKEFLSYRFFIDNGFVEKWIGIKISFGI